MQSSTESHDVSGQRARQATADILASNDSASVATEQASTSRRSSFLEQDQGVLMDVLEELDKERHKRAELEAKVRVLEQEVHIQKKKNSKSSKATVRDYSVVKAERDGYKEILDALTQERPAFSTSSVKNQQTKANQPPKLPIHIVRLLEVMPWDARAQQYTFGEEQVFEWQIYSADKKWQKELRYFPTFFKTLPIVVPTPGKTMADEASKSQPFFGSSVSPPKQCVLTDLNGSTILNIDKGYPLPNDGGAWTWVGPWKVEKNNDADQEGWSYSNEVEIMSHLSTYRGEFQAPKIGTANITKRRRKWTRARTLIDYPYASNMTREYLKLIAEKSRLDSSVEKLSAQLVDTEMSLTTLEAEKEQTNERIQKLEHELHFKNESLGLVENGVGLESSKGGGPDADKGRTIQGSNIAAKLVETSLAVQSQLQKQNDPKNQLFESLRDKGTGILEILKPKGDQKQGTLKDLV